MKKAQIGGSWDILSSGDLEHIHRASLSLLEDPGILSESDLILDLFQRGGALVDRETRIIRVPPEMVDEALKSAPKSFVLYGRDPSMDLLVEPGPVYYGMGGTSEPFFWDYELGRPRQPTKKDMVRATRVAQALENVDFVMALCSAGDTSPGENFIHEYDAIFRNTTKPVVVSALGRQYMQLFLEMAAAVSGGEAELRRRPWVVAYVTPVSPLRVTPLNEGMFEAAALGIPIQYSPGPMMGATAPVTVAGDLTQSNAEALFGLVQSQLIEPGIPFIYAPHTPAMDMATAQCTYGSVEQALGRAAVAQLGRFYELPTFNTGAGVESKLPDAQAASEAMLGMLLNGLAGMTLTQTMGTLASGLYGSLEMLVICDELALMMKRVLRGISVSDETIGLDVIREVGHQGNFLAHDHTLEYFKRDMFFPVLFRRQTIDQWLDRGAKSILEVAHERVQAILERPTPQLLSGEAEQALDELLIRAVGHGVGR
jgi:trimethylamine:corrinoid methyltransferase-like protein